MVGWLLLLGPPTKETLQKVARFFWRSYDKTPASPNCIGPFPVRLASPKGLLSSFAPLITRKLGGLRPKFRSRHFSLRRNLFFPQRARPATESGLSFPLVRDDRLPRCRLKFPSKESERPPPFLVANPPPPPWRVPFPKCSLAYPFLFLRLVGRFPLQR